MLTSIDQIEIDMLDMTGDLDLVATMRPVVIEAVRVAAAALATVVGLNADALVADTLVGLGVCDADQS